MSYPNSNRIVKQFFLIAIIQIIHQFAGNDVIDVVDVVVVVDVVATVTNDDEDDDEDGDNLTFFIKCLYVSG